MGMRKDRDIIKRIRNGNIKEFENLFRSSYNSLVNYANMILRDNDSAEEIVQDLFYVLWRDRKKLNINSSLNGYLYKSVYNRCMHHVEHQKVVQRHQDETRRQLRKSTDGTEERIYYNELNEKISKIIDRLPERCAKIFCMSRFEGMKYSEIANELSISVKTVEANMGKALKEFRKELSA